MAIVNYKDFWKKIQTLLLNFWHSSQPEIHEDAVCLVINARLGVQLRMFLPYLFFVFCTSALFIHLYKLQIGRNQEIAGKAEQLYRRGRSMTAYRGRIYDRGGNILAQDNPTVDLYAEPKRLAERQDEVLEIIASKLGGDISEIAARMRRGMSRDVSFVVMSDLTQEQADALQKYTNQALQLVGNVQTGCCVRYYPAKETAQQQEQTVKLLCSLLPLDSKDVQKRVKKTLGRYAEVPLERKIPLEAGKAIMAELKKRKIYGVRCVDSAKREYPRGAMFSNMLGVLDVDGRGVSGIESLMNKYLTPEDGYITFFRDSRGRPVDIDDVVVTPPHNGADIYLTIEEPLQLMVEEELAKMTAERTPVHAYAMMIDPTTGAIMALAQYPTFDPNNRQELLDPGATSNHILVQSYDPGSIMKCLSIAAAMERHYTNLDQVIYCEHGSYFFGGKTLHDDNHHFDNLTVAEVIQKSSNIGTAKIATEKMDDATTFECLNSYLFGKPTGLGFYPEGQEPIVFPSESKGKFRNLRNWDKLTASRMVIGQGISTSILQIAQAWCALANGGVIMQPYIIDRMVMPDGQVIHNIPREKGRPLSASTVEDIRRAMVMVTHTGGTGTKAAVPGYEVAGKTGTGQQWIPADPVAGTKGAYSNKFCLASFIGFVPADNPRFLLIVSSEGAKGYPRTGGFVSAPVFSRIAARALDYLQVPPTDEEAYLAAKEKEERNLAEQMLKEQKSQRKNTSNNKKKDNRTARR